MEIKDSPVCKNQAEIGRFIGMDPKKVKELKDKLGLPAYQINGKGPYRANKKSLLCWLEKMEEKFL